MWIDLSLLALALLLPVTPCASTTPAAEREADEVKSLPGWDKALPSKQYSGYLSARGGTRHLHYYYVESENDPSTDPVTLWLNGGPGASSIAYGMMTEIGQLVFNRDSLAVNTTAVPALQYNRFGWARFSNMLYLESPAGVGFSYCDDLPCTSNDTSTAEDAYDALVSFYARFPSLSKRPFYITGESYAGIYCPTLAEQVMNRGDGTINLKGIMVNNGCWGNQVGTCGFANDEVRLELDYQFGHALLSQRLYKKIQQACDWPVPTPKAWTPSAACEAAIQAAHRQQGPGKWDNPNTYNFCSIEGRVPSASMSDQQRMLKHGATEAELNAEGRERWAARVEALSSATETTGPLGYQQIWCGGPDAYKVWSALPEVQAAWHVKTHDASGAMKYTRAPAGDLRPLYKTLASKYPLLIYSGDADGCVPHTGTEEWTAALGYPVDEEWRPWLADAQGGNGTAAVAVGYVVKFGGPAKDFRFATVMGSGHEVPTFKPVPAFAAIRRFQRGEPL